MIEKIAEIPKKIFCEGIKCEYLEAWDEEGETWVTCTAKKCPYSKGFVKGWYKGQDDTLKRICEEIEKVEIYPFPEYLPLSEQPVYDNGFEDCRQKILSLLK